MKSDFIEFIGNARKRKSEKFRVQLSVFLVCLALSVFIWSLVRLSKDYFYSVHYKLSFVHTPSNLKLIRYSDSVLTVKIKLQGFEFFSEEFLVKQERSFEVNLRNARLRHYGDRSTGYILTNRIGREIVSQANFPNDVFFVSPDTIFLEFERENISKMSPKPAPNKVMIRMEKPDSMIRVTDSIRKISGKTKGRKES